ncbi:MAG: Fur family transcriptional regulator [Candidatus Woesearchaeota archaeon]
MSRSRTTKQYQTLKEAINKCSTFFDVPELLAAANKLDTDISQATVYRFVKAEVEANNLFAYRCGSSRVFTKNKQSHCHFICENSGKVIHFDVDNIDFLKDKIPGKISSFQIEVRGVCNDCK